MKQSKRLVLSAGEECTIMGQGTVQVALLSGVLEVAGALLEGSRPFVCHLTPDESLFVVYTLEGGAATVSAEEAFEMHRGVTNVAPLMQLTRRTLLSMTQSKVLVIGGLGEGRTLAAHTLCNALLRYSAESDFAVNSKVFLMDLNTESNCVYSPGCVSLAPVTSPLWLGETARPSNLSLSLYTGYAARPSAATMNSFVHYCEQLHDIALSFIEEGSGPGEKTHLVIDAPAPSSSVNGSVFYKKLVELLRPTHLVIIADRENEAGRWSTFLQEDIQRTLPDCGYVPIPPVARPRTRNSVAAHLKTYFVGDPALGLGCSKVVVAASALQFVQLVAHAADGGVTAQRCHVDLAHRTRVCALSHAEIVEEVPLAPIAGLLVVVDVDDGNDEVVLIIPAGTEALQRRFVIVPSNVEGDTLRLGETEMAVVEEATR